MQKQNVFHTLNAPPLPLHLPHMLLVFWEIGLNQIPHNCPHLISNATLEPEGEHWVAKRSWWHRATIYDPDKKCWSDQGPARPTWNVSIEQLRLVSMFIHLFSSRIPPFCLPDNRWQRESGSQWRPPWAWWDPQCQPPPATGHTVSNMFI